MRETSAGAVIFREAGGALRYLLLKYPSGHWDFVKGRMEPGESPVQTAVREASEETGISDLEFVDGFRHEIGYGFERGGRRVRKRVIFFAARTRTRRVRLSHEHRDYRWLGYGEASRLATYYNARSVLGRVDGLLALRL